MQLHIPLRQPRERRGRRCRAREGRGMMVRGLANGEQSVIGAGEDRKILPRTRAVNRNQDIWAVVQITTVNDVKSEIEYRGAGHYLCAATF